MNSLVPLQMGLVLKTSENTVPSWLSSLHPQHPLVLQSHCCPLRELHPSLLLFLLFTLLPLILKFFPTLCNFHQQKFYLSFKDSINCYTPYKAFPGAFNWAGPQMSLKAPLHNPPFLNSLKEQRVRSKKAYQILQGGFSLVSSFLRFPISSFQRPLM